MPYLIGCTFSRSVGWRVRKCMIVPENCVTRAIAHRDGVLWVVSDEVKVNGRFIDPATVIRRRVHEVRK